MRLLAAVAALSAVAPVALAQSLTPITATPLMPPTAQPAQPYIQAPPPPAQVPPSQQQTPPAVPPPAQLIWLPAGSAELQVLDKVNAEKVVLNVKVGEAAQFRSLNIQVQACDVHPPDQPQDSAAYLTITDSHPDSQSFRGWMLADNPSLSMLQHPIYDVRVVGCKRT
jgi:hypothetical protein